MLTEPSTRPLVLPPHLLEALSARGLVRNGRFCPPKGLTLVASGRWYVFQDRAAEGFRLVPFQVLGAPGLWKRIQGPESSLYVFEVPSWIVSVQPEEDRLDESGPVSFLKLLDWALATRLGRVPPGWAAPRRALVESWVGQGAWTVQAKGRVRQIELILGGGHWALRLPILPRCPRDLPKHRRRPLDELVADVQRRWAMVRIGFSADAEPAALAAEVDFSGGPYSELLFSAGLEALRNVASILVESAEVLADPAVEIACLALGATQNTSSQERKTQ